MFVSAKDLSLHGCVCQRLSKTLVFAKRTLVYICLCQTYFFYGMPGLLHVPMPIIFPRMRSEGFSFNSEGLGVGVVFAQRSSSDRHRSQPSATVRSEGAKPHRWAALRKCDQDDVL